MSRGVKKNHLVVDTPIEAEENLSCKVWGRDKILTNKDEIDYYKVLINQVLIKNRLVGFVTDEGRYTFEEEIKRDLVKMEKEVADATAGIYLALAIFMGKTFSFSIDVDYINNDTVEATLYLNERVEGYEPIESLSTFVAKAVFTYDDKLKENIYKTFNLVDTVQKNDDLLIPNLAVKLQTMIDQEIIFDQVEDLGAQIYIMRTLKVLSKAGKEGQEIVAEYKKQAGKIKSETSEDKQDKLNVKLQKVLDKVIEEKGGLEKLPIEKNEIHQPMKEFVDSMKKAEMAKSGVEVKPKKKEAEKSATIAGEKKEEKKTSKPAAKKPAAKKAAKKDNKKSSKDKGKDKGKDDKKKSNISYAETVVTKAGNKKDADKDEKETPTAPVEKPVEKKHSKTPKAPVDEDMEDLSSVLNVFKKHVEDEESKSALGGATQVLQNAIVNEELKKVADAHIKEVFTEEVVNTVDGYGVRVVVEKTIPEVEPES